MEISYIHHSCYKIETDQYIIIFDYWKDSSDQILHKTLLNTTKRVYFLVSHFHEDHYNSAILNWDVPQGEKRIIISYDTEKRRHLKEEPSITSVMRPGGVFEDEFIKIRAFRSTDIGVSYAIEDQEGKIAFHAGDLNNWYFTQQDDTNLIVSLHQMEGLYMSVLRDLKKEYKEIEHLMFPVDPRLGKETLRGAIQWLFQLPTKNFYPMHFWGDWTTLTNNIHELEEMTSGTSFHIPRNSGNEPSASPEEVRK